MKKLFLCVSILAANAFPAFAEETKTENKPVINKDTIEANWHILKGKVMKKWAKITDNDILHMKGTREELRGKLQEKYGYDKEKAEQYIDEFLKENNP
ncbi:CsbD family protein [Candidatus Paracaedibacter symbiosus]|uniref:CsbD family protein n=1 Tax=Candidatus Paracaedibacter symbiosus TaxID=244582 RepID=UPI001E465A62|nr:CsbD family protein [Candidatus Paracaedibacter symbiosus]